MIHVGCEAVFTEKAKGMFPIVGKQRVRVKAIHPDGVCTIQYENTRYPGSGWIVTSQFHRDFLLDVSDWPGVDAVCDA